MSTERFEFHPVTHGSGGFAKVIKGKDKYLDRAVAVKVLDPLFVQFPEGDQERFRREARILAKLAHPNIPAIYDVHFNAEHFWIMCEFIDGVNLAHFLEEQGL